MDKMTHLDDEGRARMVDVGGKPVQRRMARARGRIVIAPATAALIADNNIRKGDVLTVAEIAGVQAAKKTCELIPLCHTVYLTSIRVRARLEGSAVVVESEAAATDRTGVEMEALTAAAAALLTVYDMCKAVDKNMVIGDITLVEKRKE